MHSTLAFSKPQSLEKLLCMSTSAIFSQPHAKMIQSAGLNFAEKAFLTMEPLSLNDETSRLYDLTKTIYEKLRPDFIG